MSDEMKPVAWCNPLEAYADSYAQMSRDGDGRVDCRSVEVDIRQNMMPVVAALVAERDAYRDMAARKSDEKVSEFKRATAAERERDEARAANERDRSEIITYCNNVSDEIERRKWVLVSRGPYEWDDDRYRDEFRDAIEAIATALEPLRKIGGNLSNCPTDPEAIRKARTETAIAAANARVERLENALREIRDGCEGRVLHGSRACLIARDALTGGENDR